MSGDACGRWFAFNMRKDTLVCLERANLPEHVREAPCLETPTPFEKVITELEDCGEARLLRCVCAAQIHWPGKLVFYLA